MRESSGKRFAGLGPRLQAFLWDYLIIAAYVLLVLVISLSFPEFQTVFRGPVQSDLAAFLVLILPVILTFTMQEGGPREASFGKRKRDLKVLRSDGSGMGKGRAFARSFLAFLPWQLGHTAVFHSVSPGVIPAALVWVLFGLSYGMLLVNMAMIWKGRQHRAIHDWVTDTICLKTSYI